MADKLRKTKYKIIDVDPYLQPFYYDVDLRMKTLLETQQRILKGSEELTAYANGYLYFGFHRTASGWVFREWAPAADAVHLIGDFNNWDRGSHPLNRLENGIWEIEVPGQDSLSHLQLVKLQITFGDKCFDRIPSYIRRAVYEKETNQLIGQIWDPPRPFAWTDGGYGKRKVAPLCIYEAHIGISSENETFGTYRGFADALLPRIKQLGYNTVLLMSVVEHPYYASFGFQVSNYYSVCSRYGTPDDFKYLVNKAHDLGMYVLMDIVHSHACNNIGEGLNYFDGSDDQYFLPGANGIHPIWRSRLFNYGRDEVMHFLLSNLKFWLEEYHIDGFRFNSVSSMIYQNLGLGAVYSDYKQYFSMNTNVEAVAYLQLANELVHSVNPFAVTIAEEVSGMPGIALSIRYGGIGFDYRQNMGLPAYWKQTLIDTPDDQWDLFGMWYELTNRRPREKNVGYVESHEQAFAGQRTLISLMAGEEIHYEMSKDSRSLRVDRAIPLHILSRFITIVLASEAYLNFMGNEFGHPDWIELPSESNNWSYLHAHRQWSLLKADLKFDWLDRFDQAMMTFVRKYRVLSKPAPVNLWIDNTNKIIVFAKGELIYVFNFGSSYSPTDFFMPAHVTGEGNYQCIFNTDDPQFGGQDRISMTYIYTARSVPNKGSGFSVYIPCRTAAVFKRL